MTRHQEQRRRSPFSGRVESGPWPRPTGVETGLPSEAGKLAHRPARRGAHEEPEGEGRGVGEPSHETEGVYIISVAARLLSMHPQTLRKYERMGFIRPSRTVGRLRLYSEEDIARLRLIKHWVEEMGLNLVGVDLVVELANRLSNLRWQLTRIREAQRLRETMHQYLEEMLGLLSAGPSGGGQTFPKETPRRGMAT